MMIVRSVQDNIQPPRAPTEPFQIADDIRLKPMHLAADRLDETWLGIIIALVHSKPFAQNSYSISIEWCCKVMPKVIKIAIYIQVDI